MRIRPKLTGSAWVVAWVYAIFGGAVPFSVIGLLVEGAPPRDYVGVLGVQVLFLIAGVGILRGWLWAWWLAVALTAYLVLSSVVLALDEPILGLISAAISGIAFAALVVPTLRGTPEAKKVEPGILGGQTLPPPPPPERLDRVATPEPKRSRRKHSVLWWTVVSLIALGVLASILLGIACEAGPGYSGGCL